VIKQFVTDVVVIKQFITAPPGEELLDHHAVGG
jgi:hypothetical protein